MRAPPLVVKGRVLAHGSPPSTPSPPVLGLPSPPHHHSNAGLNEVFTGGLSSYSLFNLVLAHLQAEGFHTEAAQALAGEAARGSV